MSRTSIRAASRLEDVGKECGEGEGGLNTLLLVSGSTSHMLETYRMQAGW